MSLFAKIMVVVNLVLAVAFLAAAGTLLGAMENWKTKHGADTAKLTDDITALESQVAARDGQLESLRAAKTASDEEKAHAQGLVQQLQESANTLNAQMGEEQAAVKRLTETLAESERSKTELQNSNSTLTDQLGAAKGDASAAREEADNAKGEVARLGQALKDAESALGSQQQANMALSEKVDSLQTSLDLYVAQFGATAGIMAMKPVSGVVQAVDNEMDIVIVSVGSRAGVEVGYEFTVYRGSDYVSTIVVDKVFDTHAAARTKSGTKKSAVQAGDAVATRL